MAHNSNDIETREQLGAAFRKVFDRMTSTLSAQDIAETFGATWEAAVVESEPDELQDDWGMAHEIQRIAAAH